MAKASKNEKPESVMDYPEHERTYSAFLWLTKWTVIYVAALLIAMVAGFFWGWGLWAILMFVVMIVAAHFLT